MKFILFLLIVLAQLNSFAQEEVSISVSGSIEDSSNGEYLIGANIQDDAKGTGTVSNEYGFYSIRVPANRDVTLIYSYIGYGEKKVSFNVGLDTTINISLSSGVELEEVLVKSDSYRQKISSTQMSVESITPIEAKLLPALLGEVDILKTIQLKPGVASGSEGSSGLYVRGGSPDQNLIVLDEALVYNANHLFGFFSTFNADAIKNVQVYKGGFPAQYGGRLSSVIDVKLKEGNNKEFHGQGGIGLISSRLTLEGPIQKEKSSFIVSGRRTYIDLITNSVNRANQGEEDYSPIPGYSFYDLNAKINFELSEKDRLYVSGYFGRDVFKFEDDNFDFNFNWGNSTATVRWNHTFNSRLFSNSTFTFSDYQYNITNDLSGFSFKLGSKIQDVGLKSDLYYALNNQHNIKTGIQLTKHQFEVGRLKAGSDDGDVSFSAGTSPDAFEAAAYIADQIEINKKASANIGLRFSTFFNDQNNYFMLEPRMSFNYQWSERFANKISFSRTTQSVHLVSNSAIALPTDIWYPTTNRVKPQLADQVAIGYSYLLGEKILLNNEFYYKWLGRQIELKDHANLFGNDDLEEEFTFGKGFAYGMEISLEKNTGKLSGWIAYTLAKINRGEFTDIMDGAYFPTRYDRRHDLSVVLIYKLSRSFSVTGTFVYGSGDRAWLPIGRFILQDPEPAVFEPVVPVYGERNRISIPDYHRMDFGLVWNFFPKWGKSNLTLSIYNVYDRRNAYFLFLDVVTSQEAPQGSINYELPVRIIPKKISLFPILPAFTYNFEF